MPFFGITSALEYFQSKMLEISDGLDVVTCMMDDILVRGASQEEHDRRLHWVFQRLRAARVTLNKKRVSFLFPQ